MASLNRPTADAATARNRAVVRAFNARRTAHHGAASWLAALVTLQAALGVFTLIAVVPIRLAVLHQLAAFVLLIAAVVHLRAMTAATTPAVAVPAPG